MHDANLTDAQLLESLEQQYGRTFDLRQSPELRLHEAAFRRLLRAGRIARVGRGVLTILERPQLLAEDPLRLATAPFGDVRHYVSWRAALSRHDLTEQDPLTISVATLRRRHGRRIGDLKVRPVFQSPARFYGYQTVRSTSGAPIKIATAEKAIIDSLDRPDLAGGLPEVVKALGRREAYDPVELVKMAARYPSAATVQRLGHLMSTLGVGDPTPLRSRVRRKGPPVLLDLVDPETPGTLDSTWRVADNVGPTRLTEWMDR
jgi:predicted transcriptional regulator of viral defense system